MTQLAVRGTGSIHDLTGDYLIYRSLNPLDPRLPRLDEIRDRLALQSGQHPRKSDPAYGAVCAEFIRRIAEIEGKSDPANLLFFGDTLFNDGSAFRNIRSAGGWKGMAFIGRDDLGEEPGISFEGHIAAANRWSLLDAFLSAVDFSLDEKTVLVLDLDKTALGARGRNDGPINTARINAMRQTIQSALEGNLDKARFQHAYDTLNQPEFHPFTGDNQDYLAYLCLLLSGGALELDELVTGIRSGHWESFHALLKSTHNNRKALKRTGLSSAHDTVWQAVQDGDPTPYKDFRRAEFLATLDLFTTDASGSVERILDQTITITAEVYHAALQLRQQGVTVLGISDKPDLSSVPDGEQAAAGINPLHRQQTLIVGEKPD